MRINYNVSAMISNNALSNSDDRVSRSLQRLSTGFKINRAKDNPAGLAMSNRMNAQIKGVGQAGNNASDGVSVIEIADGALNEVAEMIQRMNELAVKAANGVNTDADREVIDAEVQQLKEEIQRISDTTEFNGQKLLNGEYSLKGYSDNPLIKVAGYNDNVPVGKYEILSLPLAKDAETGEITLSGDLSYAGDFPSNMTAEIKDDMLFITNVEGFEMRLDLSNIDIDQYTNTPFTVDATGIGPMRLQTGANEGQITSINIPAIGIRDLGISKLNVKDAESAKEAIESISTALGRLSNVRGVIGAYQNRLESTVNSLDLTEESMTAAYSRIMDTDMAEEMTEYSTAQVIVQAATSMLAQANERPSQVLQLLQ